MAEPGLSACAGIVRRYDPDLFHAALFAPEPGRERLMVLYAFDIELSRATARADRTEQGPIIAAMRLQWWRDLVDEIRAGAAPRAHEVAAPLHELLTGHDLPKELVDGLIAARDLEMASPLDAAGFARWRDGRFGGLVRLAARLLCGSGAADGAAEAAGRALGTAFALRLTVPMAVQSQVFLLPDLTREERSALVRGETTDALRNRAARLAEEGLEALAEARRRRSTVPRAAVPAFLPLWRADLELAAARRPGIDLAEGFPAPGGARRAAMLTYRALTGRW